MDCREYRRLLSREIDGEIDPGDRLSLDRHLASCESCRRAREEMLELVELHRGIPEREPSPMLAASIMARIGRVERRGWIGGLARVAFPIAAAVVLVLGIYAGSYIVETVYRPNGGGRYAVLELEYLEGYPPGSVGDQLFARAEGGESE